MELHGPPTALLNNAAAPSCETIRVAEAATTTGWGVGSHSGNISNAPTLRWFFNQQENRFPTASSILSLFHHPSSVYPDFGESLTSICHVASIMILCQLIYYCRKARTLPNVNVIMSHCEIPVPKLWSNYPVLG